MILLFSGLLDRKLVGVTTFAERLESFKAGILGAVAFTFAYLAVNLVNYGLLTPQFLLLEPFSGNICLRIAIAPLSGFLFAVTYRYIIRRDENSHLKDGAVLAFGLVRGLATPEVTDNLGENLGLLSLIGIESLICFAFTRLSLDLAISQGWLKPFS